MDSLNEVFQVLESAKLLEKNGNRIEAATKYYQGCHLMRMVLQHTPQSDSYLPTRSLLEEKIEEYTMAAQRLYFDDRSTAPPATVISRHNSRGPSLDDISVLTNQTLG